MKIIAKWKRLATACLFVLGTQLFAEPITEYKLGGGQSRTFPGDVFKTYSAGDTIKVSANGSVTINVSQALETILGNEGVGPIEDNSPEEFGVVGMQNGAGDNFFAILKLTGGDDSKQIPKNVQTNSGFLGLTGNNKKELFRVNGDSLNVEVVKIINESGQVIDGAVADAVDFSYIEFGNFSSNLAQDAANLFYNGNNVAGQLLQAQNKQTFPQDINSFKVTAVDDVGGSPVSLSFNLKIIQFKVDEAKLVVTPLDIPDAPNVGSGSDLSLDGFTADWEAAISATGYKLSVAKDEQFVTPIDFSSDSSMDEDGYVDVGDVTSFDVVTDILVDETVYYRVVAYGVDGDSVPSEVASLTLIKKGSTELTIGQDPVEYSYATIFNNATASPAEGTFSGSVDGEDFTATIRATFSSDDTNPLFSYRTSGSSHFIGVHSDNGDGNKTLESKFNEFINFKIVSINNPNVIFEGFKNVTTGRAGNDERMNVNDLESSPGVLLESGARGTTDLSVAPFNQPETLKILSVINSTNNKLSSFEINGTTLQFTAVGEAVTTPPDAPVATAAANVTESGFTANWNASADATGYKLTVADNIEFTSPIIDGQDVGDVQNYSVVTPMTPGIPLYYKVVAVNGNGDSDDSNPITVLLTVNIKGAESGVDVTTTNDGSQVISNLSSAGSVSKITLECWIKLPAAVPGWTQFPQISLDNESAIGFASNGQSGTLVVLGAGDGDTVGDNNANNFFTVNNIRDDKWHHYAVVVDLAADGEVIPPGNDEPGRKAIRVYIDGIAVMETAGLNLINQRLGVSNISSKVNVGNQVYPSTVTLEDLHYGGWQNGYKYQLDELRVWKEARTQDQIRDNMNRTDVSGANLVAYYKCDGSKSKLVDETGNYSNPTFFDDPNASRVESYAHVLDASTISEWNFPESVGSGSVTNDGESKLKLESASLTSIQYAVSAAVNQSASTVTTKLPAGVASRLEREWFFFDEGSATVDLTFDLTIFSISDDAAEAKLLYRADQFSDFTEVAVNGAEVTSGIIKFSSVTLNEGYYTFGSTKVQSGVPDAPIATAATNVTETGFNANWSASTDATGYKLTVADNIEFTSPILNGKNVGNVLTYSVSTKLTEGTPLYYRVVANNDVGDSADSNVITVTYSTLGSFFFAENFETVSVGDIANDGTDINGITFRGSSANSTGAPSNPYQTQVVDGKDSYSALGKCISLWCEDDTQARDGEPTWGADGNPDVPTSNIVIELPQDTTLTKVALDVIRPSGGQWWTKLQYSDDDETTWKDIKSFSSTALPFRIYNEDSVTNVEANFPLVGVDALRINVWRNGTSDPGEILIDNIALYETAPSYNLVYDFENDDAQNWRVQSGSTFNDPVTVGNDYAGLINGTYCLNTLYAGNGAGDDSLEGTVRSPVITIDPDGSGIIEYLQGGGNVVGSLGLAVYDAETDQLIARTFGENKGKDPISVSKRIVNVSDYKGKDIYLELYDSNTGSWGHALVDNIRIEGVEEVGIPGPTNFTATPTSATDIELNWDAVQGADEYNVSASYDASFNTPVTGYPKKVTALTESVGNLIPDTELFFSVTYLSGGVESSPTYANAKTFYNAGTTDGENYYLQRFDATEIGRWDTINVKTMNAPVNFENPNSSGTTEWYINQSNDFTAEVNSGNTIQIKVDTEDNWSVGKVWIDWNHNGRFEDTTYAEFSSPTGDKKELVGYFANRSFANGNWDPDWSDVLPSPDIETLTITIPDEVNLASLPFKTRIRIAVTDGGQHSPDEVLPDNFSYTNAQLQDYGLYISDSIITPEAPTLSYQNLSETGFTLNWTGNADYVVGHYLTIATDASFLNPIDGYSRKPLGAVFEKNVLYTMDEAIPLFCKISAYNLDNVGEEQESPDSDDLIVVRDAPVSVEAGQMATFDGSSQGYYVQTADFDNITDLSFSTWIVAGGGNVEGAIFALRSADKNARFVSYLGDKNLGTVVDVGYGSTIDDNRENILIWNRSEDVTLVNAVEVGKATHIAFSFSVENQFKAYINGKLVYTKDNFGLSGDNPGYAGFGYYPVMNSGWMKGSLDETAVWNKILTGDEVKSLVHSKITGVEDGLMLAYDFNTGSAIDIAGNGYDGTATGAPALEDSSAILVNTPEWTGASVSWNGNSDTVDVGGMALANVEGIVFDKTYVAYGPLKYDGGDDPADGQEPEIVSQTPPADLKLTVRNLDRNTDAQVRLKRLFEVDEKYVEATADVVFDKSQLSVIFGTTETFRLVRTATEGGDFELVASTNPENNGTTTDSDIPPTEYAIGVEENGFITFSSIGLKDGFYTLASQGSGLTPAFDMTVTQVGNIISWTVGTEYNVSHYEVYDSEGNLIEIVNVGETYEVELPNDFGGTVKVVDKSGGSSTFSGDSDAIYTLTSGWNLISIPLVHADISELKEKAVGGIWGWTGSAYEIVDSADVTDAVWVYVTTESSATVTGVESDAEIKLNMGWNMVGPTSDCNVPANAISVHAWKDIYSQLANEKDQLHVREGYWIFCTEPDVE